MNYCVTGQSLLAPKNLRKSFRRYAQYPVYKISIPNDPDRLHVSNCRCRRGLYQSTAPCSKVDPLRQYGNDTMLRQNNTGSLKKIISQIFSQGSTLKDIQRRHGNGRARYVLNCFETQDSVHRHLPSYQPTTTKIKSFGKKDER